MRSHRGLLSIAVILLAILTLAAAFALAGCEKDEDPFDPDVQVSPGAIDFNAAIYRKVRSFFCDASYCSVKSANDPDEGYVIKLVSKNAKGNKDSIPEVCFEYGRFCESVGAEPVDLAAKPFVVLKVKAVNVHDQLFSLTAYSSADKLSLHTDERSATVPAIDSWNYIVFDLSGETFLDQIKVFRLRFEQLAVKSGETLLISEMRFCDEKEAQEYMKPIVYDIEERTADNYTLRVLSYNIQTEAGNDAPFPIRAAMVKKLIDEVQPDIAGLQEATKTWRSWLTKYVFNDSYDTFGKERTTNSESNAIFYRKDKFDLLDQGTFWLSPTPEVEGSGFPGYAYVRICTWGHFRDKVTGTEFVHMNLHLDINGEKTKAEGNQMRADQMAVVVRFAQRFKGLPVFVSGDFNTLRHKADGEGIHEAICLVEGLSSVPGADGNECRLELKDTRLNAARTVDSSRTATLTKYFDKNYSKYEPGREPIDYIFYDANFFEPLTYDTYLLEENGYEASDHLAVFATFKLIP